MCYSTVTLNTVQLYSTVGPHATHSIGESVIATDSALLVSEKTKQATVCSWRYVPTNIDFLRDEHRANMSQLIQTIFAIRQHTQQCKQ